MGGREVGGWAGGKGGAGNIEYQRMRTASKKQQAMSKADGQMTGTCSGFIGIAIIRSESFYSNWNNLDIRRRRTQQQQE